jgi:hypothetical protein
MLSWLAKESLACLLAFLARIILAVQIIMILCDFVLYGIFLLFRFSIHLYSGSKQASKQALHMLSGDEKKYNIIFFFILSAI